MYKIKHAAAQAGISVELLRAWERRYGVVAPTRTAAGYRLYDDEAIARIRAMRRLVGAGWSPSIAAQAVIEGGPAAGDVVPATDATTGVGDAEPAAAADGPALAERFVQAAAALDGEALDAVLDDILVGGSYERVAEKLLLPAVVELGNAWADGRLSVAAEHAASHAVIRRLGAALEAAGASPLPEAAVLVGLPPGSRHEIGALAFAVAVRRAGLPVLYLGADLPIEDWISATRQSRAAVIGVVTAQDVAAARELVAELRRHKPGLIVALGGKAAPDIAGCLRLPQALAEAVEVLRRALS